MFFCLDWLACKCKCFLILELHKNLFLANVNWVLDQTYIMEYLPSATLVRILWSSVQGMIFVKMTCCSGIIFIKSHPAIMCISTYHCSSTWYVTCNHHITWYNNHPVVQMGSLIFKGSQILQYNIYFRKKNWTYTSQNLHTFSKLWS